MVKVFTEGGLEIIPGLLTKKGEAVLRLPAFDLMIVKII